MASGKTARAPAQNGRANPIRVAALDPGTGDPDAIARAKAEERSIAEVQGAVEGAVVDAETVTFMGADFRIADSIGLMPLLKFAHSADRGIRSQDMAGMAAMYSMIRDCIDQGSPCTCGEGWIQRHPDPGREGEMTGGIPDAQASAVTEHKSGCEYGPGDWPRFEDHAIATKAEGDDLFQVVTDVIEKVSARPTRPRSGSSPAEPGPSPRSRGLSPPQAQGLVPVDELLR